MHMPTIEQFLENQQRSDTGLLVLTGIVLLCCILLIRVWRVRLVPRAAYIISRIALPLVTITFSPLLAFGSASWGLFGGSILFDTVPKRRLREIEQIVSVLFLALVVRVVRLGESFWFDEAFTATVARLPLASLPSAIAADVHPPLYFAFKWLWAHLVGIDPAIFRLPDLVCGLITVYLLYRVTLKFQSHRIAISAAILCALTPAAVYYSVEARGYALLSTLVLWALLELLEGKRLMRFALIAALLPALHNLGWIYLGVFGLIALVRYRQRVIVPLVVAVLLAQPNMALALFQSGSMTDGYWLSFSLPHALWGLVFNVQAVADENLVPLVLPYIAIVFLSVWASRRLIRIPDAQVIAALTIGVPALLIIVSIVWQPVFLYRAMLPVMMLMLIPIAVALHGSSGRYFRPLTSGIMGLGLMYLYINAGMTRPDYGAMLERDCGGASIIYATSMNTAFVASANTDRRVLLWESAQDDGQTLTMSDMASYGIHSGIGSGFVCIFQVDNPRSAQSERDYIASVITEHPLVSHSRYEVHRFGHVNIYVVMM